MRLSCVTYTEDKSIETAAEDNCLKGEIKTDDDSSTQTSTNTGTGSGTAEHLAIGSQFTFCINLLQASGIPADYCDVYCQFRFDQHSAYLLNVKCNLYYLINAQNISLYTC